VDSAELTASQEFRALFQTDKQCYRNALQVASNGPLEKACRENRVNIDVHGIGAQDG